MRRNVVASGHAFVRGLLGAGVLACAFSASAQPAAPSAPLQALASLPVEAYLGQWYQVAWTPNRFQSQCVSDTTATYYLLPDGMLSVLNACRTADGRSEQISGVARPDGNLSQGELQPAQLQVSFLPAWLRWTGLGWANYWVIQRADDLRYAVVSEPGRDYLWVLARQPRLNEADMATIRQQLLAQGFELQRLVMHPHTPLPTAPRP